jgi:hypothetical protein
MTTGAICHQQPPRRKQRLLSMTRHQGLTKGTLDFSAVTHDLEFVLNDDGKVTITARVSKTSGGSTKVYTYEVLANGIATIVGGKGTNTYRINSSIALKGNITTPVGGQNILDYSGYTSAAPIVVDTVARVVTGLNTGTAPAATLEKQQLTISAARPADRLRCRWGECRHCRLSSAQPRPRQGPVFRRNSIVWLVRACSPSSRLMRRTGPLSLGSRPIIRSSPSMAVWLLDGSGNAGAEQRRCPR